MRNSTLEKYVTSSTAYPLISGVERLVAVRKIKGMWKNRKPKMVTEYKKIRKELNRK